MVSPAFRWSSSTRQKHEVKTTWGSALQSRPPHMPSCIRGSPLEEQCSSLIAKKVPFLDFHDALADCNCAATCWALKWFLSMILLKMHVLKWNLILGNYWILKWNMNNSDLVFDLYYKFLILTCSYKRHILANFRNKLSKSKCTKSVVLLQARLITESNVSISVFSTYRILLICLCFFTRVCMFTMLAHE